MSSILKALKKLEDDKVTHKPDDLNIDADILRPDSAPRISATSVVLIALLLLAGGSGATYLYMKRDKVPEQAHQSLRVLPGQYQPSVSDAPQIKTERLPPAITVVPAQQNATIKRDSSKKTQLLTSGKTAVVATPLEATAKPVDTSKGVKSAPLPSPAAPRTVPELRVNGIAFQEGASGSMAMINGVPMASGSQIDGVKIEEIFKNRVKFNYNGEVFEILLGQSNR